MENETTLQLGPRSGTLFLRWLHLRLTQAVDEALLNKVKRWTMWSLAVAWATASIVFGSTFSRQADFWFAMRQGFSFFWLALGVTVLVSTFGISNWLGKRERQAP